MKNFGPIIILLFMSNALHSISYCENEKTFKLFNLTGVVPPVFTPTDDEGNLNLTVIPKYAKYLKENGISNILIAGTTGEGPALTVSERKKLLNAWLGAGKPLGLGIIMQVGGEPMPYVKEMARYSEEVGADAIISLPELYYRPHTPEELVKYLENVCKYAPNTPLLYYHYVSMSLVNVDMLKFYKLATKRLPNFSGMTTDLETALLVRREVRKGQTLFVRSSIPSVTLAPTVLIGFDSFISVEANIFPRLVLKLVHSGMAGNLGETRKQHDRIQQIDFAIITQPPPHTNDTSCEQIDDQPMVSSVPTRSALKATMSLVTGINVGPIRDPQTRLTNSQLKQLRKNLIEVGVKIAGD